VYLINRQKRLRAWSVGVWRGASALVASYGVPIPNKRQDFMMRKRYCAVVAMCVLAVGPAVLVAEEKPAAKPAALADEPLAGEFSLPKSAEHLDGVTTKWIEKHKCASCHTGYPYLIARASLGDNNAPALLHVRTFLEDRVAAWDNQGKGAGYLKGEGPVRTTEGVTEVVAIAATLASHDAQSGGQLHPRTRQALERMWELQREDGSWTWNKTGLAPFEHDIYYGAVYAAVGVGHAPEGYAQSDAARVGVSRLRRYLQNNPPPDLHHKTWLLWASLKLDGLLDPAEREQTVGDLLALQRDDGGWSLPSLRRRKRRDGKPDDRSASDGYATGLILYVLRQTGVGADAEPIRRGVAWLKTHQRASGRWFTQSLNGSRANVISNAGTAFAVMALTACEAPN
jgi:squalene-hopene/tetraprenyl-beta-curcumene cyclase